MAGIYVHIPFCKVKCHYCDFHFSTNLKDTQSLVNAILCEIELRSKYLQNQEVSTIYFGGGTPSILTKNQLNSILEKINAVFEVNSAAEITLEGNPDDLTAEKLQDLKELGVNRLSIGIQSFNEDNLLALNRAHTESQAFNCIKVARELGFDNITIDLIYGLPNSDLNTWSKEIDHFLTLKIPHLSAYCLTIEPNTVFGKKFRENQLNMPTDETSLAQFKLLISKLESNGYEHYEISNFSLPNKHSKHNSAYWMSEHYLGIGPSAHSYNGESRAWNVANNIKYINAIKAEKDFTETEELTIKDQFNEYILTRIRTKWGINLSELALIDANFIEEISEELKALVKEGLLIEKGHEYYITNEGKFLSDAITARLFIE